MPPLTTPGTQALTAPDTLHLTAPDMLHLTTPDTLHLTAPDTLPLTAPDTLPLTARDTRTRTKEPGQASPIPESYLYHHHRRDVYNHLHRISHPGAGRVTIKKLMSVNYCLIMITSRNRLFFCLIGQ
jgi:hypothetical protein